MPTLHSKQEVTKLFSSVRPPFENGFLWSISNLTPSCGVLPQYWQVNLSLLKILNLIRYPAKRFLEPIFLRLNGSNPAKISALFQDPNLSLYTLRLGNLLSRLISLCVGARPKITKASLILLTRYSSERILNPFGNPRFPMRTNFNIPKGKYQQGLFFWGER